MSNYSQIKKYFTQSWLQTLLVVCLISPTFFSLIRPGFYPMQDDLQAFRIQQMGKCFVDFQIPCHWIPDMGYQYGYPQFLFYSPSVYYLGAMIHLLGIQIIDVVKILFGLGFIFGALAMYGFLKNWLGAISGILGALLYSYVPFKAAQVYVRGSLSEFWAMIFFPLLFWFSRELIIKKEKKYGILFALAIGALLITHNLMSFIFFPILAGWVLVWIYLEKWKGMKEIFIYGSLGVGLSAFFILPLLFERQYVHTESLLGGYFDYRQHFVNLQQLFLSNYWGYGSSVLGDSDEVTLSVGIVQWIVAMLGVLGVLVYWKTDKKIAFVTGFLVLAELGVLFLMHQKSSFIWGFLPVLSWLQFPWRLLATSSFLLALLGSLIIPSLLKILNIKWVIGGVGGIFFILLIMYGSFFTPRDWLKIADNEKFSGQNWEKQLTISIFDYLPKSATLPPNKKAPQTPEIMEGEANFNNYQKYSNYQTGEVTVLSDQATIRYPIYDFPGMKLWIDGAETPFWSNDCRLEEYCFGLITSQVNRGEHTIKVGLTNTYIRTIGNAISLVSIVLLIIWVVNNKRKSQ